MLIGKTVSLDPETRVVVPEGRHGLYAIDVLDPDLVCRIVCPNCIKKSVALKYIVMKLQLDTSSFNTD